MEFADWFERTAGHAPHDWQRLLGERVGFENRLIRIPTGMGKTLGVLAAWTYHRLVRRDVTWPRRLVWCLPMRTLVEQTAEVARDWLDRREVRSVQQDALSGSVPVHVLLGGASLEEMWHLEPEAEAVLIGTQDMLLSRALNRGYGTPRGRWPMEFALLHRDSLWILDEVQLMDVGLRTSVQLQAARESERARLIDMPSPACSWWMSATLQPEWLRTRDFIRAATSLEESITRISPRDEKNEVVATAKPLTLCPIDAENDPDCREWARLVASEHRATATDGPHGRVTLVIANTVDDATTLYAGICNTFAEDPTAPQIHLIHSRFRPLERQAWKVFLSREACIPGVDRIIVSTQVVEAGIDMTASALISQIAPWPSLIQRFGRAGRYGEPTRITVVDRKLSAKSALPYEEAELTSALTALERLTDASPIAIDALEDQLRRDGDPLLAKLYAHDPLHELELREFADLFDTGPDLTGLDIDVSRFIRSGEERDLHVWWWNCADEPPPPDLQPTSLALCPVPAHRARKWLTAKGRLKDGCRAWVWDYLDGRWKTANESDLFPGRTVLVDLSWGGYVSELGWTAKPPKKGTPSIELADTRSMASADLLADLAQDHENLSESPYKTIATHGREVAEETLKLTKSLSLGENERRVLDLAARLHDYGKSHTVFQSAMDRSRRREDLTDRNDLAKAPESVWRRGVGIFGDRRGFRHELASTLGMFELLRRADPSHPAITSDLNAYIEAGVLESESDSETSSSEDDGRTPLQNELVGLDTSTLDLVAYLVCSHHGKIRCGWQATPADQERALRRSENSLRGIVDGDCLPEIVLAGPDGTVSPVPETRLHLDLASLGLSNRFGASWMERTSRLRHHLGDLALAYLETILRTADVRASRRTTVDPLIEEAD